MKNFSIKKYFNLFNGLVSLNIKKRYILVTILMLCSMVLEIASLNFIFIIVKLLTNPNILEEKNFLLDFLSTLNTNKIFINVLIVFVIVFLTKNFLNIFLAYKQAQVNALSKYELSNEFFISYMSMPKIFHLRTNSSKIIKNIVVEVEYFCGAIIATSSILMETIVLLGITSFLFYLNPYVTLISIGLFLIFSFLLGVLNSKRIVKMANSRSLLLEKRLKFISEGLSGKIVFDLHGTKKNYFEDYKLINFNLSEIIRSTGFRFALPKPLFEIFAFILIVLFLLFSYKNNYELENMLPLLAVYITAAYRLIPSFSKIAHDFQKLQSFGQSGFKLEADKKIFKQALSDNKKSNNLVNFNKEITLKKVKFSYSNEPKNWIFEDINLKIKKGEKIGIFGSSGSGKSTLIDIISGLLACDRGEVLIDGINLIKVKNDWQSKLGVVPQDVYILDDTIKKNIAFGLKEKDIDQTKLEEAINRSELRDFISSLEYKEETIIGERGSRLSGGQKQRIGIARAIYNNPEVLIFDESTNALDKKTEEQVITEIFNNNQDKTIIFISHNFETLKYCNQIYELSKSKLILSNKKKY